MPRAARVTDALRGRKKAVVYVGTAAALLGAGTASAATVTSTSTAHAPAVAEATTLRVAGQHPVKQASEHSGSADDRKAAAHRTSARVTGAHAAGGHVTAGHVTGARRAVTRDAHGRTSVRRAAAKGPDKAASWNQVIKTVAKVSPAAPAAANELQPVAPAGTQAWMPVSGAQLSNAATIVKQAYVKKMGVRSAVIAVATAMQESTLNNVNYGTSDSVGLFQQRPSCGWGTVQQIMDPAYAADAFLTALHQHQASDPGWATQPLWATVQQSGFPFAYAKWESQAAHLVKQITTQLR